MPKKNQSYPLGEAFWKIMVNFNLLWISLFFENLTSLGLAKFQKYPGARLIWPGMENQAYRQSEVKLLEPLRKRKSKQSEQELTNQPTNMLINCPFKADYDPPRILSWGMEEGRKEGREGDKKLF